jgi:hypothetical protein
MKSCLDNQLDHPLPKEFFNILGHISPAAPFQKNFIYFSLKNFSPAAHFQKNFTYFSLKNFRPATHFQNKFHQFFSKKFFS